MKLVRVLVAAATAIVATAAIQVAAPSAGAANSTDCAACWPPGIVHR